MYKKIFIFLHVALLLIYMYNHLKTYKTYIIYIIFINYQRPVFYLRRL